jgi:hypothetical protein
MSAAPATVAMEEDELTIFPNPTNDKISLGGTYSGQLVSQLGQVVMKFSDASELSLKELQSGVYILKVDGSAKLYRVVKE